MLNVTFICRFNERILVPLAVPSGSVDLLKIITWIKTIQLYYSPFYLKLWRWIQSCQPCTSKHLRSRYLYQASPFILNFPPLPSPLSPFYISFLPFLFFSHFLFPFLPLILSLYHSYGSPPPHTILPDKITNNILRVVCLLREFLDWNSHRVSSMLGYVFFSIS